MNSSPRIVVVVPVHERKSLTLDFIQRWKSLAHPGAELVIIDDGSKDGTAAAISEQHPEVVILSTDGNAWWAGATNEGIRWALSHGADYILTINDDAQFDPDFLKHLMIIAQHQPDALVGARIMRQDTPDTVWAVGTTATFSGRRLWTLRYAGQRWVNQDPGTSIEVDTLCGNGCLIPARVFRTIGLFDAQHLPQYHADSDLVLRARASGFRALVALDAIIYNHIAAPLPAASWKILFAKCSPLRLSSLCTILWRHAPPWRIPWILMRQCIPPLMRFRR